MQPPIALGPVVSTHPCRYMVILVAGVVLSLTGIVLIGCYFSTGEIVFPTAGGMALFGGLLLTWWAKVMAGRQIVLHEGGLTLKRGSRIVQLPWSEIRGIHRESTDVHGGQMYTCDLLTRSGKKHQLDDQYQDITTVLCTILDQINTK